MDAPPRPFWHPPPPPHWGAAPLPHEAFWAAAAHAAAVAAAASAPPFQVKMEGPAAPPPMWFPMMHGFPPLMAATRSPQTMIPYSSAPSTVVDSSGSSSLAVSSSSSPVPLPHALLPNGYLLPSSSVSAFPPLPPPAATATATTTAMPPPPVFRPAPSLAALAEAAAVSRGDSAHVYDFSPITTVGLKKAATGATPQRRRQRQDSSEGDAASSGGGSSADTPSTRRKTARTNDDDDHHHHDEEEGGESAYVVPSQQQQHQQHQKNRRVPTAKTSLFRGVSRCGKDQKFQARIRLGQNVIYLGRFRTELEAAFRYDDAVRHYSSAERHLWVDATNFREMTEAEKELVLKDFLAHGQELREEMFSYLQPSTLKKLRAAGAA